MFDLLLSGNRVKIKSKKNTQNRTVIVNINFMMFITINIFYFNVFRQISKSQCELIYFHEFFPNQISGK